MVLRSREINAALTAALAGPRPSRAAAALAYAAYGAALNGTLAIMSAPGEPLTRTERAALITAALRALHPDG
jgi:hypothetical protein